jgi:hypothetical protein
MDNNQLQEFNQNSDHKRGPISTVARTGPAAVSRFWTVQCRGTASTNTHRAFMPEPSTKYLHLRPAEDWCTFG